MKVIVVLAALCSLIAFSEANTISKGNRKPCCPTTDADGKPLTEPIPCMTFKEFVALKTREIGEEIDKTPGLKRTPELELQIKIKAIKKAALQCSSSYYFYANTQFILEELHAMIDKFPTPRNVEEKFNTAEHVMTELSDKLRTAQNEAVFTIQHEFRHLVHNFGMQSSLKLGEVYDHILQSADVIRKAFDREELMPEIDKIVEKVDDCLVVDRKDHVARVECHERVRFQAYELYDKMHNIPEIEQLKVVSPETAIERLIIDITADEKALEDMLMKLTLTFVDDYTRFTA